MASAPREDDGGFAEPPPERRSGSRRKKGKDGGHRRRHDREPSAEETTRAAAKTDAVAREAARLLDAGKEPSIRAAILSATRQLDAWDAPRPSRHRVREHSRSMAMEELGEAGYFASIAEVWYAAEEVMTLLEQGLGDVETELVGRAARGLIDAGVVVHIRAYTERPIGDLAETLVEHGYEEPTFETVATLGGLLDRLRFFEEDHEIAVTRVPRAATAHRSADLVSGKAIDAVDLETLTDRLTPDHARDPNDANEPQEDDLKPREDDLEPPEDDPEP